MPPGLESPVLPGLAESTSRLDALKKKLAALNALADELRARRKHDASDDDEINPNLDSITSATRTVQAEIAAEETPTLQPPNAADVAALEEAIRDAETAIAQNAKVNELVKAAAALIRTLKD
jgi:uncharacterized coiled-coil DUF342 family protein